MINFNKKQNCFIFLILLAFPFFSSFANDDYNCTQFLSKQLTDLNLGTFDRPKEGKVPKKRDSSSYLKEWSRLKPIIDKLEEEVMLLKLSKNNIDFDLNKYNTLNKKLTQLKSELKKIEDRFEFGVDARNLQERDIIFDNLVNFGKGEKAVKSGLSEYHMKNDLVAYYKGSELVAYSAYNYDDSSKVLVSVQNSNCKILEFSGRIAENKISDFSLNQEGCQYLLKNKKQFANLDIDSLSDYKHRCNEQGGRYSETNIFSNKCYCYKKAKEPFDYQNSSNYINPHTETCEKIKIPHIPSLHEILFNNLRLRKMDLGSYTKDQFNLIVKLCEKYQEDFSNLDNQEAKIEAGKKNVKGSMK